MILIMNKSWARRTKKKKRNQNQNGDIITPILQKKRIMREYCEQLYTNKSNNLDLMDKLLEKQDRSSKKQKENLNKYIISK